MEVNGQHLYGKGSRSVVIRISHIGAGLLEISISEMSNGGTLTPNQRSNHQIAFV